jgi:hypothetical protein
LLDHRLDDRGNHGLLALGLDAAAEDCSGAGITGPATSKPVELENGTIVSPGSTETSGWNIRFALSRDGAKTWQEVVRPKSKISIDAFQPTILNHRGGHLEALGRTRNGHVFSVSSWITRATGRP